MNEGKLCGDVDYAGVSQVAGYITPVPGGVGPMTITMLLVNTAGSGGARSSAAVKLTSSLALTQASPHLLLQLFHLRLLNRPFATMNPLLRFDALPLFDQIRPEHVCRGHGHICCKQADAALDTVTQPGFPADWECDLKPCWRWPPRSSVRPGAPSAT